MASHVSIDIPEPITEPQPVIPQGIQPYGPPGPQLQAVTAVPPGANHGQPPMDYRDAEAQRGENYGDPSGRLWMMYLTEAEKEDKEITKSWKGDAEGILLFTGLFSGTVATFIIASYPNLSPNSSDTTNALLTQISQQLVNISNATPLTSVAAQITRPFQPTASDVRVNVMWILSLVLSLTCALSTTLVQQWARRYLRLALRRGAPHKRARMRAYISDGIEGFKLKKAIEAIVTLLHLSVFLFFTGLVEFLFPINTTVAYFTLGSVTLFAFGYAILTILPNLSFNCPYRTPLSAITWRLSHGSIYGIFLAIRGIEGQIHEFLLALWRLAHPHARGVLSPTRWREVLDNRVGMHHGWLLAGLGKSVELSATGAPATVDAHALEWTLTALDEDKEIEDFAARVPGFFDSRAVPDPASAILPLMSDHPTTDPILGSRLSDLLKTCIPGTSPLTEEKRKSRLRVCLKSLWCCGKAYNEQREMEPLPSYFHVVFASPEMTHRIQTEQDPAARVIGSCFGALVAKKLSADINSRRVLLSDGILACLSAILGVESRGAMSLLSKSGAIELASIISLMSVDPDMLAGNAMPDVLDVFTQTLQILSQTLLLLPRDRIDLPLAQVAQFHDIYSRAPHWLKSELQEISDCLPSVASYAPGGIAFPEPELHGSWTNISHVSQQSREDRVDSGIGGDLVMVP